MPPAPSFVSQLWSRFIAQSSTGPIESPGNDPFRIKPISIDSFFELSNLEVYLERCEENESPILGCIALLLLRVAREKIAYFQDKYNFQVENSDLFYTEDLLDFMCKRNGIPTEAEELAEA